MIAVSLFISQDADKVRIQSLAADDLVSKAIERMLREQAANLIQYIEAAHVCVDKIQAAKAKQ